VSLKEALTCFNEAPVCSLVLQKILHSTDLTQANIAKKHNLCVEKNIPLISNRGKITTLYCSHLSKQYLRKEGMLCPLSFLAPFSLQHMADFSCRAIA